MIGPSAHLDTFSRDNLPEESLQPDFLLDNFNYPSFLNVAEELTDAMVKKGFGDNIALIGNGRRRTYKESRLCYFVNELMYSMTLMYC